MRWAPLLFLTGLVLLLCTGSVHAQTESYYVCTKPHLHVHHHKPSKGHYKRHHCHRKGRGKADAPKSVQSAPTTAPTIVNVYIVSPPSIQGQSQSQSQTQGQTGAGSSGDDEGDNGCWLPGHCKHPHDQEQKKHDDCKDDD